MKLVTLCCTAQDKDVQQSGSWRSTNYAIAAGTAFSILCLLFFQKKKKKKIYFIFVSFRVKSFNPVPAKNIRRIVKNKEYSRKGKAYSLHYTSHKPRLTMKQKMCKFKCTKCNSIKVIFLKTWKFYRGVS